MQLSDKISLKMRTPDILMEGSVDFVWQEMEFVLANWFEPTGNIGADLVNALLILRKEKFFVLPGSVHPIIALGCFERFHPQLGIQILEGSRIVGEINKRWVIDPTGDFGKRVYFNREDYVNRSGVLLFMGWKNPRSQLTIY